MRVLSNYRTNPANTSEPLILVALDGKDVYGCNHRYAVIQRAWVPAMSWATGVLPPTARTRLLRLASANLTLQTDAPASNINPNLANSGTTDLMLLGVLLDHLQARQASALASEEQASAITSLQAALTALQQRTV